MNASAFRSCIMADVSVAGPDGSFYLGDLGRALV